MESKNVLLISVGGSPEQTAATIKLNGLDHVIFFCSKETYSKIHDVRELLNPDFKMVEFERIVTEKSEELGICYSTLMIELPKILKLWRTNYKNLVIDYTGGTKAMSAALVLATIEKCNQYSYVGGKERTKDGVGIVVTGSEKHLCHENPWNTLAIGQLKVVDTLFNKARYGSAVEKIYEIKDCVDEKLSDFYNTMSRICEGYYEWDSFRHKSARDKFESTMKILKRYQLANNEGLNQLISKIEENVVFLNELAGSVKNDSMSAKGYHLLLIDLISNAKRRAEKENKFDDAVARLYSSIEKAAKMKLLEYGINNSKTRPEDIPDSLKSDFEGTKYTDKSGQIFYKYGFEKSCRLLSELNAVFGEKYMQNFEKMRKLMSIRNDSILGHGIAPVTESTYLSMLEITLDFLEIGEDDLINFPEFNLNDWGSILLKLQSSEV